MGLAGAIQQKAGTLSGAGVPGHGARRLGAADGVSWRKAGWPGVGACAPGPGIVPFLYSMRLR